MPTTKGEDLSPIEIGEIGQDIKEAQIQQMLAGLAVMPQMLSRLEAMATRGDETAAEVVRRWKARP